MYGNTTVTAYDNNPLYTAPIAYSITYQVPAALAILFAVIIKNGPTVPSNAAALVQAAIIEAFAGEDGGARARIGSQIFASRYYSAVAALGSWAQIISLTVGCNNNPDAIFSGTISGTTLTVVHVNSGVIVTGGIISDPTGRVLEGTKIIGGSGSTWTVSLTQTVAGASFTGTAGSPTTHLVVTSVTGTIQIGDSIAGTGITAGTTIVSQFSGTPGGAGEYVLSAANTASAAACTTSATITSATPNLNSVQVQANQVPVTDANLIAVTVS